MKVVLYARVSREEGQTPENQLDILRPLAERRGYEIVGEYVDRASGKDANRPEFARMMDSARARDFDAIMSVRLDRIMRSVIHLKDVLDRLDRYRVALILSDMEFDPSTPNGRLMINIVGSIAEWERDIISTRTREGLARKKAKGLLGKPPRSDIPVHRIALMRIDGMGWKAIADAVGIPKSTIMDRRADIDIEIGRIKGSDNGGA